MRRCLVALATVACTAWCVSSAPCHDAASRNPQGRILHLPRGTKAVSKTRRAPLGAPGLLPALSLRGGSIGGAAAAAASAGASAAGEALVGDVLEAKLVPLEFAKLQLAGKLLPALRNALKTTEAARFAAAELLDASLLGDGLVICALWAAALPLARLGNGVANGLRARTMRHPEPVRFEKTLGWALAQALRGGATLLMALYCFDVLTVALSAFKLPVRRDLPRLAMMVAKPCWVAYMVAYVKMWLLGVLPAQLEGSPTALKGRKLVYDRLADFGLGVAAFVTALDLLSLELGVALTSLLAVGGLSSVVVALACQEPLSHLVYGLLVTFSDKFRPGDEIRISTGSDVTAGVVTKMGWFDTWVRKYDESTVIIPNGKIMGVPITNLSRMTWGEYSAEIRLRFEDLAVVEAVCAAMRAELASLAPSVVMPPLRHLWVHLRSFDKDCILVGVDCKIRAPGGSTRYHEIRERINLAIARAVLGSGAQFALPAQRKLEDEKWPAGGRYAPPHKEHHNAAHGAREAQQPSSQAQ